jgi:AraC-like DNA-binding protein
MKDPKPFEQTRLLAGEEWLDATPAWRFVRLDRGAAYWLAQPGSRALAEGELVVVPPETRALVRASQLNEVVLHALRFSPALLAQLFQVDERQLLTAGAGAKPGEARFLPSTHPAAQRFADLIANTQGAAGLSQRAEALGVLAEVFDSPVERRRPPSLSRGSVSQRFERVVAPLPEAELIFHSAAQLAGLCGCSPRHFNRLFRRRFGSSFRARQTELRLLKARSLLLASETKIRDIALQSGYRNLGLFHSLFRRRFGLTPSDWRRSQNAPAWSGSDGPKA